MILTMKGKCLAIAVFGLIAVLAGPLSAQSVPQNRDQIKLSYAPLVKQAAPAVVNIYAKRLVRSRRGASLFNDPIFNRLFGDFPLQGFSRERLENSLGSGVIVRAGGFVVTNNHVIDDHDAPNGSIATITGDAGKVEAAVHVFFIFIHSCMTRPHERDHPLT